MASKIDFSKSVHTKKTNTGITAGQVQGFAERGKATAHQQGTASFEEQANRCATRKTQGRKGCKLPRINLAFDTANYDFIRTMAGVSGMSMTDFINTIITQYRLENMDIYEKSKEFKASLKPTSKER